MREAGTRSDAPAREQPAGTRGPSAAIGGRRVLRGTAQVAVIQGAGLVLGYAGQVLLARLLGAGEYGVYRYALSWAFILSGLACMGFPTVLQRFVPEHVVQGDWSLAKGLVQGATRLVLAVSVILAIGLSMGALLFRGWIPEGARPAVLIGIWLTPLLAVLVMQSQIARAVHRYVLAFLPVQVGRPALAVLLAGVLLLSGHRSGLAALCVYGGLLALLVSLQWSVTRRSLPSEFSSYEPEYAWRRWLNVAVPLFLMASGGVLYRQVGTVLVGSFLGTEQAGQYAAILQFALLGSILMQAVSNVLAPYLSRLFHGGQFAQLQRLLAISANLAFWPTMIVLGGMYFLAEPILGVLGDSFVTLDTEWALRCLLASQVVNVALGHGGILLNVSGYHRAHAAIFGVVVAVSVSLNVALLPLYGIRGAAMAQAAATVVWRVALWFIARWRLGLEVSVLGLMVATGRRGEQEP